MRSPRSAAVYAGAAFGFILVVALLADHLGLEGAGSTLQARSVEASAFGAGDLAGMLMRMERIYARPAMPEGIEAGRQEFSRTPQGYGLDPVDAESLARTYGFDPIWLDRDVAILALQIDPALLAELVGNPLGRGREWERRGFVAYFERGRPSMATGVGLRIHGGATREIPVLRKYRLIFRDEYGLDHFTPDVFPERGDAAPVRLVLDGNRDGRTPEIGWWRFLDPLAYDVARRAGLPGPHTRQVQLFLNSKSLGVYNLTEYLGSDWLRARFGHDRFVLVRSKRNADESNLSRVKQGDPARYRELLAWLESTPTLTLEEASRIVDVDNLSRWFVTVLFCATGDIFNGPLLLDETRADARWFWAAWDLQISFGLPYFPHDQGGWERDIFSYTVFRPNRKNLRAVLLRRLIEESAEFRVAFAKLFSEILNHRLTEDFLGERLNHYRTVASDHRVQNRKYFEEIERFFAGRKEVLREQMGRYLGAGQSFKVIVRTATGEALEVDGYAVEDRFEGWYFSGQTLVLEVPEQSRGRFMGWTVDGLEDAEAGLTLRLTVERNLVVQALFESSGPGAD